MEKPCSKIFIIFTIGVLALARADEDPPEGVLDKIADDHVDEENKDIFWFAFLIGGIGTVILVVSVILCLSCVCGVDVCFCCRKWCKGCGGPEQEELLPEDYTDAQGGFDYGAVEPYGDENQYPDEQGWGPGTQYNTLDDLEEGDGTFAEEAYPEQGYDENNANNMRQMRGSHINQNNRHQQNRYERRDYQQRNSNDKGTSRASRQNRNYNQHSNAQKETLCTHYRSFPQSTNHNRSSKRRACDFCGHNDQSHDRYCTRHDQEAKKKRRNPKHISKRRSGRRGYTQLSDTPDHTQCPHFDHPPCSHTCHRDHQSYRSACHSSDTLSRCNQHHSYQHQRNVNNSAAKAKDKAFMDTLFCCCPCCCRSTLNKQRRCGSDSSRCDLNAPPRAENNNANANNMPMEYSRRNNSGDQYNNNAEERQRDDGGCCCLFCFPFCIPLPCCC